jgi:hypothetical protein
LVLASWAVNNASLRDPPEKSNVYGNGQFTYKELKVMTANFNEEIGQGGFHSVFLGHLEDGSPAAVRMCSKTISRGDKEFSVEVVL